MSAHQSSGSLLIIIYLLLMSGEVTSVIVPGSTDPCYSYKVMDDPWRATNYSNIGQCDRSVSWAGWYRLMYKGLNIRMPESCVNDSVCGTSYPLWLNGRHPQRLEGVVSRPICGKWSGSCCYYSSRPIRVKACQGNYYVYEFVMPLTCSLAYCADITTITPAVDYLIKIKHLAGLTMRLSSAEDLRQSSTREILMKQVKRELVRKGLPANITLQLKSISKLNDENSDMLKNGSCLIT